LIGKKLGEYIFAQRRGEGELGFSYLFLGKAFGDSDQELRQKG